MEKITKPNDLSELLNSNITRKKTSENALSPKNTTDANFDKQQSERFNASSKNFTEWNMEMRKELYEFSTEIFDKWKESYGEQLLLDWKKNSAPQEAALNLFKMFQSGASERKQIRKNR